MPSVKPQPEPLEFLEKNKWLKNLVVLACGNVSQERRRIDNLWSLRNFLKDHLFLHTWVFKCVLDRHPCNDLFLMDSVVHRLIKFILRKRTNDLWAKKPPQQKWKIAGSPNR